jgi:membrane-associated phospholipid phosphatase
MIDLGNQHYLDFVLTGWVCFVLAAIAVPPFLLYKRWRSR